MDAPTIGITADDLTGAADTAAALARAGRPVVVSLGLSLRSWRGRQAVAVNTDSRTRQPEEAYRLTRDSVVHLLDLGANLIYKKTDSNLRGNVGAELAAMAEALGRPVLFAPAFPARGRTVVDGLALIGGVPVADTEMGRDPEAPVTCSGVAELLREQWPAVALEHCPLRTVRAGVDSVTGATPERGVLILDAETEDDLHIIARAGLSLSPFPVLAGSAGLARALADLLLGPRQPISWAGTEGGRVLRGGPERRTCRTAALQGPPPLLAVLASSSSALAAQVERAQRLPGVSTVTLPCGNLSRDEGPLPELHEAARRSVRALTSGQTLVICAAGPLPKVQHPVELVVQHLAHLAFVVVKETEPRGLLVGGGSTAQGVLEALGVEAIEVDDEPEVGVGAGVLVGGELARRPVVLKPGAAGDDEVVARLLQYLRRRATAAEKKQ